MTARPFLRTLAAVAAAGTALGACGGSSSSTPAIHGPAYEVTTAGIGSYGPVLVNGAGYALYVYEPDHQSSHSTCYGTCAVAWPPLLLPKGVSKPIAAGGAQASMLGTTIRSDGQAQLTYDGWPLYRWTNDTSPGEATGQGLYNLGGYWYLLSSSGSPVH